MINPKVKKGDMIIMRQSHNSQDHKCNIILEVVAVGSDNNISAKAKNGEFVGNISVYNTNPADVYELADRESQAAYLEKLNVQLKEQIKKNLADIEYFRKFKSEEEYVAYKIDRLMKTKGIAAKAALLKELKQSHFI